MIKRIDLFRPLFSEYGVMHHFTDKIAEALRNNGINCRILEAERTNPGPFLKDLLDDPPDCTLSINGLLPDEKGRFFCDLVKIPHVACLIDSPNPFFPLIKSPHTVITCIDRYFCQFFREFQFDRVIFFPHGVEKELSYDPQAERPIEVLMLASCIDYEAIRNRWPSKYSKPLQKAMDEAVELTLSDQTTSYIQAFIQALDHRMKSGDSVDPRQIDFGDIFNEIEAYIRGKDRHELLKAVKGAPVHVYGAAEGGAAGWKDFFPEGKSNIIAHDPVPYEQALQLIGKSKILLSSTPSIKNGGHERIFSGPASGALVITSENKYLKEKFTDGEDIVFYRHKNRAEVDDKISEYLKNEDLRKSLVKKGSRKVAAEHTWDHRVRHLIEQLDPILESMS